MNRWAIVIRRLRRLLQQSQAAESRPKWGTPDGHGKLSDEVWQSKAGRDRTGDRATERVELRCVMFAVESVEDTVARLRPHVPSHCVECWFSLRWHAHLARGFHGGTPVPLCKLNQYLASRNLAERANVRIIFRFPDRKSTRLNSSHIPLS